MHPVNVNVAGLPGQIAPPPATVGAVGFAPFVVTTAAADLSDSPHVFEHVTTNAPKEYYKTNTNQENVPLDCCAD